MVEVKSRIITRVRDLLDITIDDILKRDGILSMNSNQSETVEILSRNLRAFNAVANHFSLNYFLGKVKITHLDGDNKPFKYVHLDPGQSERYKYGIIFTGREINRGIRQLGEKFNNRDKVEIINVGKGPYCHYGEKILKTAERCNLEKHFVIYDKRGIF